MSKKKLLEYDPQHPPWENKQFGEFNTQIADAWVAAGMPPLVTRCPCCEEPIIIDSEPQKCSCTHFLGWCEWCQKCGEHCRCEDGTKPQLF